MKRSRATAGLLAVLAGTAISTPTLGQEGRAYLGGGLALQDVDGHDSGSAMVLRGGYDLFPPTSRMIGSLALEGELTRTLTSPESGSRELDITSFGTYAAYTFPIQRFLLRGRAGFVYQNFDFEGGGGDDDELDLSAGLGAGYRVTRNFDVTLEYTFMGDDVSHLGLHGVFHF